MLGAEELGKEHNRGEVNQLKCIAEEFSSFLYSTKVTHPSTLEGAAQFIGCTTDIHHCIHQIFTHTEYYLRTLEHL